MGVISDTEIIHLNFNEDTNTAENFLTFLYDLTMKIKADRYKKLFLLQRKVTILLDNAKIHTAIDLKREGKAVVLNY